MQTSLILIFFQMVVYLCPSPREQKPQLLRLGCSLHFTTRCVNWYLNWEILLIFSLSLIHQSCRLACAYSTLYFTVFQRSFYYYFVCTGYINSHLVWELWVVSENIYIPRMEVFFLRASLPLECFQASFGHKSFGENLWGKW